jgi:hypothetical protein
MLTGRTFEGVYSDLVENKKRRRFLSVARDLVNHQKGTPYETSERYVRTSQIATGLDGSTARCQAGELAKSSAKLFKSSGKLAKSSGKLFRSSGELAKSSAELFKSSGKLAKSPGKLFK